MNTTTKIGFRQSNTDLSNETEVKLNNSSNLEIDERLADRIVKMKGWQKASKILEEYFRNDMYPFLKDEKRDDFFIKKLSKIRERYFEPI